MSQLQKSVKDYLALRQALGFKLERAAMLLPQFAAYLDAQGSPFITTKLALSWAMLPAAARPYWWARRLSMVRCFALHLKPLDPKTEIPPQELIPYQRSRLKPYIYSDQDVLALMQACLALQGPLRPATYKTLIGLLAITGMRVGEAIALNTSDVNFGEHLLIVRNAKFGKTREVALHPTTIAALQNYACARDRFFDAKIKTQSFFVSQAGTRLYSQNVWATFDCLRRPAKLPEHSQPPRIHDLRHSFAIKTLIRWYAEGVDVEAKISLLSTYLGHVNPSSTYYYLSAFPELMTSASQRLEQNLGDLP